MGRTTLSKTQVVKALSRLPDEFSLDELIRKLTIIQKIEKARHQPKNQTGRNEGKNMLKE